MPMVPLWQAEAKQFVLGLTVVVALVALSLTLLTGWGGQVSLAQFALVGVGAYTAARLGAHGWPFLATLVVAGAVGAAVAVAIGLPAVRTPGLTLAVTTLGFAVTSPSWLFRQEWAFPSSPVSVAAPTLPLLGTLSDQRETYYLALALLVTAMAALGWMRRSTPGRVLIAVRDNEVAAQALGLSPVLVKLAALAGSGLLAGMAGVAFVAVYRSIAIETFPPQQSLAMLAVVVVGGVTSLLGAVAGAVALVAVPNLTADWFKALFSGSVQFQLFLSGLGLVITQLANPGGIAAGLRRRRPTRAPTSEPTVGPAPGPVPTRTVGDVALAVEELHVSFGGIAALDGASLVVRRGEIVGLIGTNGAGKTTLLDVVSGVVRAGRGHVVALGRDVTRLSARRRADAGMARSFQDARLFPGLTVGETVKVALAGRWRREGALRAEADEILAGLGLGPWSDVPVAHLSTGTRRLCDLAVQLARKPALLLLDEPTAGIAQRDAEAFGPLLRRITDELGCATLLVEHDMPLMLGIADRVYCMERGRIIAEGTPEQIRNDPGVIASYLGTDEVAVARSGGLPTASS